MSGRQIREKLFNLLNAEQQHELIDFITEVKTLTRQTADVSYAPLSLRSAWGAEDLSEEMQIGDLYLSLDKRMVCVRGKKIELSRSRPFITL